MTPEQVRERLRLQPWGEFVQEAHSLVYTINHSTPEARDQDPHRRTGRTTRMLVQAVSEITEGRSVVLITSDTDHTKYIDRILEGFFEAIQYPVVDRLGRIKCMNVLRNFRSELNGVDPFTTWLGIDHTVIEFYPYLVKEMADWWTLRRRPREETPRPLYRTAFEALLDDPWDNVPDVLPV